MTPRQHLHRLHFAPPLRSGVNLALRGLLVSLLWLALCGLFAWTAYGFYEPAYVLTSP